MFVFPPAYGEGSEEWGSEDPRGSFMVFSKLPDPTRHHQGGTWKVPFSGRFKEKERQPSVWILTWERWLLSAAQGSAGHGSHVTRSESKRSSADSKILGPKGA